MSKISRGLLPEYYLSIMNRYDEFPPSVKSIKEVLMRAIETGRETLEGSTDANLDCEGVVICAIVKIGGAQLSFASRRIKQIHKIVMLAFETSPFYVIKNRDVHFVCDKIEDRPAFIRAINKNYFELLPYFTDDKEMVMLAVSKKGKNLEYASLRLRDDEEVVMTAVECCDASVLRFASKRLRSDAKVCLRAIECGEGSLKRVGLKLLNKRDFILQAVIRDPDVYCAKMCAKFKDDKEIMTAVSLGGLSRFRHFSATMLKDKEIVMNLLANEQTEAHHITHIPLIHCFNLEVMLCAIPISGFTFAEIPCAKLREDKRLILMTHIHIRDVILVDNSNDRLFANAICLLLTRGMRWRAPRNYCIADIVVVLRLQS